MKLNYEMWINYYLGCIHTRRSALCPSMFDPQSSLRLTSVRQAVPRPAWRGGLGNSSVGLVIIKKFSVPFPGTLESNNSSQTHLTTTNTTIHIGCQTANLMAIWKRHEPSFCHSPLWLQPLLLWRQRRTSETETQQDGRNAEEVSKCTSASAICH